jgi:hypothetical protein
VQRECPNQRASTLRRKRSPSSEPNGKRLPKRSGANGTACAARRPAKWSCPPRKPASQRSGNEEKADSTGVHRVRSTRGVAPDRVTCRARTASLLSVNHGASASRESVHGPAVARRPSPEGPVRVETRAVLGGARSQSRTLRVCPRGCAIPGAIAQRRPRPDGRDAGGGSGTGSVPHRDDRAFSGLLERTRDSRSGVANGIAESVGFSHKGNVRTRGAVAQRACRLNPAAKAKWSKSTRKAEPEALSAPGASRRHYAPRDVAPQCGTIVEMRGDRKPTHLDGLRRHRRATARPSPRLVRRPAKAPVL